MPPYTPAIALLLLALDGAHAQVAGDWRGYWARAGDTMPVTLHLRRADTSRQLTATFDADRLRVMGIPFTSVAVAGSHVTMRLVGDRTTTV